MFQRGEVATLASTRRLADGTGRAGARAPRTGEGGSASEPGGIRAAARNTFPPPPAAGGGGRRVGSRAIVHYSEDRDCRIKCRLTRQEQICNSVGHRLHADGILLRHFGDLSVILKVDVHLH